jgi:ATP-dependent Clp protease protease subunit
MDAETWMDANKAVELGFADEIMKRSRDNDELDAPVVSMLYSQAAITNSLMDKIAAKCRIQQKPETQEHSVDDYLEQLNNKKFHV